MKFPRIENENKKNVKENTQHTSKLYNLNRMTNRF